MVSRVATGRLTEDRRFRGQFWRECADLRFTKSFTKLRFTNNQKKKPYATLCCIRLYEVERRSFLCGSAQAFSLKSLTAFCCLANSSKNATKIAQYSQEVVVQLRFLNPIFF